MSQNIKVSELINYANENPELISMEKKGQLVKLNYTKHTQYHEIWNKYTIVSRGIIIDTRNNQIIAHPIDKFYNDFELEKKHIEIPYRLKYWITEKLDGIMIVPYRDDDGDLKFSTRGVFDNEFTEKAYKIATFKDLPLEEYSFIFELISPEYSTGAFLVTRYEKDALVLVGVRDKVTDELLTPLEVVKIANKYNLHRYQIYDNTLNGIQELKTRVIGSTLEGWVIFFENKFLMKVKRTEYFNIFRAINQINYKTVLKTIMNNNYDNFIMTVPEEIRETIEKMHHIIEKGWKKQFNYILSIYQSIPEQVRIDRKAFFLYLMKELPKFYNYLSLYYKNCYLKIHKNLLKIIKMQRLT